MGAPARCGEAPVDPSPPAPPTPVEPVEPAAKTLSTAAEDNEDFDSDQFSTPLPKASPPTANPATTVMAEAPQRGKSQLQLLLMIAWTP